MLRAEILIDQPKADPAIVVVGVDDGKGRVNHVGGRENGMGGAPGLGAALGNGVALGQQIQLLIGVAHRKSGPLGPRAHAGLEGVLNGVLNNEYHRLKSRAAGVIQAVIQDRLAAGAHGLNLFQPAKAAAHPGGHDHQNRFFGICHRFHSLFLRFSAFLTILIILFLWHGCKHLHKNTTRGVKKTQKAMAILWVR